MDAQWYCPPDVGALDPLLTIFNMFGHSSGTILHRSQFAHSREDCYAANEGE